MKCFTYTCLQDTDGPGTGIFTLTARVGEQISQWPQSQDADELHEGPRWSFQSSTFPERSHRAGSPAPGGISSTARDSFSRRGPVSRPAEPSSGPETRLAPLRLVSPADPDPLPGGRDYHWLTTLDIHHCCQLLFLNANEHEVKRRKFSLLGTC